MTKKKLYSEVVEYFSEAMPAPESELNYRNNFELLVAVILSAQCTDKRVNLVTPALFEAMPTPQKMAASSEQEIFKFIRSVSYPNSKASHLLGMARGLVQRYESNVPSTREELESLSGVGRKTASVILAVAFGQGELAVDTHVHRVAARIGLSRGAKTPLDTERQLVDGFSRVCPREKLPDVHHWLILHGRYVCTARAPKCEECGISAVCSHFNM